MNSYASIDVSYELIERIERQRKHLALVVTGAFIPAFLGLMVNAYLFLLYTHQKSPEKGQSIFFVLILSALCLLMAAFVAKKYILLKKYNERVKAIAALEDAIYNEVLKGQTELLGKIDP